VLKKRLEFIGTRNYTIAQASEVGEEEKAESLNTAFISDLSEARMNALGTINRALFTSKPSNLNFLSTICNVCKVLIRNPFSLVQLFLMLLAVAGILVFGFFRFKEMYDSTTEEHKPLKMKSRDEYLDNEELIYQIPTHHVQFWFGGVDELRLNESYSLWLDDYCNSSVGTCLEGYFREFVSYHIVGFCTKNMDNLNDIYVKNRTVSVTRRNGFYAVDIAVNFDTFRNSTENWFTCGIFFFGVYELGYFDFAEDVFLWMEVSRSDSVDHRMSAMSGSAKIFLFGWQPAEPKNSVNMWLEYQYEEITVDGLSEFTATKGDPSYTEETTLGFFTYANPTVLHYETFIRYDWTEWLADVGGFATIVATLFHLLSKKFTFFVNRNDPFVRRWGILPFFSRVLRNSEELAGVKYLVLAALGISEDAYFAEEI